MNRVKLLGLTILACALVWLVVFVGEQAHSSPSVLAVHFLDVGQGDAILIETPDGQQVLIDGGRDTSVLRELASELGFFDRTIDVVIATHEDIDHIGGLVEVLDRYAVSNVVLTNNQNDTTASAAWRERVAQEGAEIITAQAGQVITVGATELRVLFPVSDPAQLETNAASVITQVQYGDVGFMLTGDAPVAIEKYLVHEYDTQLESEVLKLGHHGSKTSTAQLFLDAVDPQYAVVSAGCDNRYGHPHQEVLDRVADRTVVSTCESGTISFYSDGTQVWQNQ